MSARLTPQEDVLAKISLVPQGVDTKIRDIVLRDYTAELRYIYYNMMALLASNHPNVQRIILMDINPLTSSDPLIRKFKKLFLQLFHLPQWLLV